MYLYLAAFFALLFTSCSGNKNTTDANDIPSPPVESCVNVELWRMPLTTHGFSDEKYDTVIIQTYRKNAAFDSIISIYKIELRAVNDSQRQSRSLDFPKELTTNVDLKIIFGQSLEYRITDFKTDWVPRWCNDFCGYECTVISFKLNNITDNSGGNIFIKEPSFKYPWEK